MRAKKIDLKDLKVGQELIIHDRKHDFSCRYINILHGVITELDDEIT